MAWWINLRNLWRAHATAPQPDPSGRLRAFQSELGIVFRDPALLRQALTHRSFLGSSGGDPRQSNERMEFLGDAVLELSVVEYLYRKFPEDREGDLTKKKGLLVSRDVLATAAREMALGNYLLLSDAERDSGGETRPSILADALEAVIGALYLDQGLDSAIRFIHTHLLIRADAIVLDPRHRNFKSQLQELVQARYRTHPKYRVVTEVGPDHRKLFTIEVSVRGTLLGRGQGFNKKEAEQAAAAHALLRLPQLEAGTGDEGAPAPAI